jgi:hypothetical protein
VENDELMTMTMRMDMAATVVDTEMGMRRWEMM